MMGSAAVTAEGSQIGLFVLCSTCELVATLDVESLRLKCFPALALPVPIPSHVCALQHWTIGSTMPRGISSRPSASLQALLSNLHRVNGSSIELHLGTRQFVRLKGLQFCFAAESATFVLLSTISHVLLLSTNSRPQFNDSTLKLLGLCFAARVNSWQP